jgi:hypothetical protein
MWCTLGSPNTVRWRNRVKGTYPAAKFVVLDWGEKVSSRGWSYRPVRLHTVLHTAGGPVQQPYAGVHFIPSHGLWIWLQDFPRRLNKWINLENKAMSSLHKLLRNPLLGRRGGQQAPPPHPSLQHCQSLADSVSINAKTTVHCSPGSSMVKYI